MSVDATRIQEFCIYGLMLFSGAFQVTLAFVSLHNLLGWPAFVGVAIMVRWASTIPTIADRQSQVISVPLNTLIASVLKKLQLKQMKSRDKRTNMMSELLNNIKRFALSLLLTVLGFTAF